MLEILMTLLFSFTDEKILQCPGYRTPLGFLLTCWFYAIERVPGVVLLSPWYTARVVAA